MGRDLGSPPGSIDYAGATLSPTARRAGPMDGPPLPHKWRGLLRESPDARDDLDVARAGAGAGGRALRDVHGVPLRVRRQSRRSASRSASQSLRSSQSAHGGAAEIQSSRAGTGRPVQARACVHESNVAAPSRLARWRGDAGSSLAPDSLLDSCTGGATSRASASLLTEVTVVGETTAATSMPLRRRRAWSRRRRRS